MQDVGKSSLRIAALLMMAVLVAHCGDNNVHIRTGGGVAPSAGTFTGVTGQGGDITLVVGSIKSIAFECDGEDISETFAPPKEVNADGTFEFRFSDGGREFHISGRFSDNNNVDGIIDDEDNQCDTGFDASRVGAPSGSNPTPTPVTSGGKTSTPGPGGVTATPTPAVTTSGGTPGPGDTSTTATATPGPSDSGPTPTPTGASCPTQLVFTGTSTLGVLDTGWTGQGHDATVISEGSVTVTVTGCAGTAPNCGECGYTGPVANGATLIQNQRCSLDSAIHCTTNAECTTGTGTCKFFFGSFLPLAAGGVATCVENTFAAGISGTANVNTGSSAGTASVTSRVFSAGDVAHPCPNCTGDTTPNDGNKQGTCGGGIHAGGPCDASGSSPNVQFGTTSLDCPLASGGVIATLPIDLSNTTGNKTRTLSAASPECRGDPGKKCQCDTCNTAGVVACSSNADCADPPGPIGPICGGKRCVAGGQAGAACTANSECPGAACSIPGEPTKPNACDDHVCSPNPGTPGPNDGTCLGGPFDNFCSPVETFRGCLGDSDCPFPGDSCTGGKNRDCFDNGTIGDVVTATGQADVPVAHASNPALAALFCIGHTSSTGVNKAAGLPGLGRLELQGHATDNGTP